MTGHELQTLRETMRFSPAELAVALDFSPDHVLRLERGEYEISEPLEEKVFGLAYYVRSMRGVA